MFYVKIIFELLIVPSYGNHFNLLECGSHNIYRRNVHNGLFYSVVCVKSYMFSLRLKTIKTFNKMCYIIHLIKKHIYYSKQYIFLLISKNKLIMFKTSIFILLKFKLKNIEAKI